MNGCLTVLQQLMVIRPILLDVLVAWDLWHGPGIIITLASWPTAMAGRRLEMAEMQGLSSTRYMLVKFDISSASSFQDNAKIISWWWWRRTSTIAVIENASAFCATALLLLFELSLHNHHEWQNDRLQCSVLLSTSLPVCISKPNDVI